MQKPRTSKNFISWIFMFGFVLFDLASAFMLFAQWRTGRFTATDGRILRSEVVVESQTFYSESRPSPRWELSYEYQVAGQRHVGHRHRRSADVLMTPAAENAAKFPSGSTRKVYFDPGDPAVAVIEAGLTTTDFVFGAFLVLANLLIALLVIPFQFKPEPNGGVRVRAHGTELRVWITFTSTRPVAIVVFFIAVAVLIFLTGLPASIAGIVLDLLIALGAAGWAASRHVKSERKRGPDLVFDSSGGRLTRLRPPPPVTSRIAQLGESMMAWKKSAHAPVVLPFQTIRRINVGLERVVEEDSEGGVARDRSFYHVIAMVADAAGNASECPLATMSERVDADNFAAWIRSTLGLA